ncbi:unnamed protein product [Paramecium sonneborni]|uniref:BZIP domain-containing protein n=1 Tax=Paramecium sonneborni TaxID=65129 RepID=A0A8S1R6P2_9CILI|nr:unnamed protein product [Paramecium sonneborni]
MEEIDQFIHDFNNQTNNSQIQTNINQDSLLVQNVRLLQQLHEQQKMLNLQSLFNQNILPNPNLNQQIPQNTKKIKKIKSTLQHIQSNTSLRDQPPQIQDIKGSVKNAYIKKITSLLSVEGDKLLDQGLQVDLQEDSSSEEISNNKKTRLTGLLGSTNDLICEEYKNQRLRQSAKQSRQRKKVYVKLLEKKISDLDQKIQEYKKTTKQSFEYLTQLLTSHPILNSMIIGSSKAFDQIMQCNQSEQAQLLNDSYMRRYGICGIQRKQYIKYAIQNIQKNFLKGNYGLLLISTNNQMNNYDEEFNNYVEIVKKYTKLDDNNLIYKVLPIIDKLFNHRKMSQMFLLQLNKQMKNLKLIQQEIDETLCQFMQSLTSMQLLEFFKGVEQSRNFNRSLF